MTPTVATAALPRFRTQAFIDGRFADAASGETFDTENPATGQVLAPGGRGRSRGRRPRGGGGPALVRLGRLVAPGAGGPQGGAASLRRCDRGGLGGARNAGLARGRQADHRHPRRRPPRATGAVRRRSGRNRAR